jgi:hypothetical protein
MMVGENQALGTDNLPCTSSSKNDYGVLKRCFVQAVQLFFCKLEASLDHVIIDLFTEQVYEPHALVCACWPENKKQEEEEDREFLHRRLGLGLKVSK